MKIVLAISSLGGGGAERVMAWLSGALANNGHEVTLLTMAGPEDDKYPLDRRVSRKSLFIKRYFKSSTASSFINLMRWRYFLVANCHINRADVVLSFIDGMNITCLSVLLDYRIPVVVSERTDPAHSLIPPLRTRLRARLYHGLRARLRPWLYRRRAAQVVFQTAELAGRFRSAWRLPRAAVIPNAVLPQFTTAASNEFSRIVLSVGRLDPQKGHDILLDAWHRLGNDRQDWKLRIVGDGPERARYESMVRDYSIDGSVELAPFTQDVVTAYTGASIFVLPSRVEGFPNALIEAMAVGNAVIASDLPPACREIVTHDADGLLYDGGSADALAEALRRLIQDSNTRSRLATAAREVRVRYSEAAVYALWEKCLAEAAYG